MLKHLSSHDHFISFITDHVSSLSPADIQRLRSDSFDSALYKVQKINFDSIHGLLQPLYSNTGRPAKDQIEIFRSLLLMNHFGFTSIDKWVKAVASDHLYAILAGFDPSHLAPLGSYYAFMHRVWGTKKIEKIFPEGHHKKDPKNKKPASGQKWDNVPDGITAQLLDKYTNLEGTPDPDRPELILQELFNELALLPSIEKHILDNPVMSADGSSLHILSNPYGIPIDKTDKNSKRRYSDPDADWGWDSHEKRWYFGYSLFALSCHSPSLSVDLPLFFSINPASQHDSVSLFPALAQFRSLCPKMKYQYLCGDSAFDNQSTFLLCKQWGMTPVIDFNKRNTGNKRIDDNITLDEEGHPLCHAGYKMTYDGYCKDRDRHKYRCPLKTKKVGSCHCQDACSDSPYGRTFYIQGKDNPRYAFKVLYKSKKWKELYKNRTSSERVNNRILNNYNVEYMHTHTTARYSFFTMLACINIHLDAWYKKANQEG